MDTHTAVAAHVCAQYRKDTKDEKKMSGCFHSKSVQVRTQAL